MAKKPEVKVKTKTEAAATASVAKYNPNKELGIDTKESAEQAKFVFGAWSKTSFPAGILAAKALCYADASGKAVAVFKNEKYDKKENALIGLCISTEKGYPFTVGRAVTLLSPSIERHVRNILMRQDGEDTLMQDHILREATPDEYGAALFEYELSTKKPNV